MPRLSRTLGVAVSGLAVTAALVSCGAVTVRHDLYGANPAPSVSVPPATPDAVPTVTATPTPTPSGPSAQVRAGIGAVGDSVMLGAKAELVARGLAVNAVESRQFHSGVRLVRSAAAKGSLPRNVVVHLGTNGTVAVADCRALVDAAGPDRRVFLVTVHAPRSWVAADNAHLRTCAASYADRRVVLVDWNRPAAKHPAWFYADGIHLNGRGRAAYAAVVTAAVVRSGI